MNNEAIVCAITKPSIKLVEIPFFEKTVTVMDRPPISPDVNIVPYRGIKDKLLFLLQGNVGRHKLNPIYLDPAKDQEVINQIRISQNLNQDELVEYAADDPVSMFEVFRIDKKPERYDQFRGSKIVVIRTDQFDIPCKTANAGSFLDTIVPNKKYYYTFRSIDKHGHFSNPSPIYEVEISYDAGAPFLLMRVIDFENKKNPPQFPSKTCKRYIHIKPAHQQTIFNEEKSGVVDSSGNKIVENLLTDTVLGQEGGNIHLGSSKQTLWDKKIKIRVISKNSGKKIDFNLKFEHKPEIIKNDTNNNLC